MNGDYTPVISGSYYVNSVAATFRYITITVDAGTPAASTSVDWIRIRKSAGLAPISGASSDPTVTVAPQLQLAPTISSIAQTTTPCSGDVVTVTITGNNFDNASSVTFNGITAQSFHVDSRTQITATSGTGVTGGAISIAVNTPGGPTTTSYNIIVNPLPASFTVSGGGHYCAGGASLPITLSGSENGVSYQLFQGATAVGSALTGTGSGLSFPPQTANAAYSVVATNLSTGCKQNMTGNATVVIDPLPAQFNVTVTGTGSFCSGGAGPVIGLSGSQAGVNYQLYLGINPVGAAIPGNGSAISFGNQTAPGTYTVTAAYTTGNACSNNMNGNAVVTVNPLPTGNITVTETSGKTA